jgi:hypothetical protein
VPLTDNEAYRFPVSVKGVVDLASGPIKFVDGRHDRFDQPPADTRFL